MWVVKLGGSLAGSPQLPAWLSALQDSPVILVPGGGVFADAVRDAQRRWQFSDTAAHEMAILAMNQYGRMLLDMQPGLGRYRFPEIPADSLSDDVTGFRYESDSTLRARVWLPTPEALQVADLPASWELTSDSLAAWLAGAIGAEGLLLVKSVAATARPAGSDPTITLTALMQRGWVDPAFAVYGRGLNAWWCGSEDHVRLLQALLHPDRHWVRILRADPLPAEAAALAETRALS